MVSSTQCFNARKCYILSGSINKQDTITKKLIKLVYHQAYKEHHPLVQTTY